MEQTQEIKRAATISKEELAQLPTASFRGAIHVIDKSEDVAPAINKLRAEKEIGFDTETKPSFKKGQINKVSLLQLSSRKECFLFRLNHIGVPDDLRDLLENPEIIKVGLSIHDDFHNLNKICSLNPEGFIDLQNYVKDYRIYDNSLSRIYAILFGKRLSKGQRLTNWEASELSASQKGYAALDALACIDIYDFLRQGNFIVEESPYFREIITEPAGNDPINAINTDENSKSENVESASGKKKKTTIRKRKKTESKTNNNDSEKSKE